MQAEADFGAEGVGRLTGPILAIDQNGQLCRAVLFSADHRVLATAQEDIASIVVRSGWVEFDAEEVWSATIATCRAVLLRARVDPGSVAAIGISSDAGSTALWDRNTGAPIYNVIANSDHRTDGHCKALRDGGVEGVVRGRTGQPLDSTAAATKLSWMLDNVASARTNAENGQLAFGGLGCFLLWRLTNGRVHATDVTSASTSLLFNVSTQAWDAALLDVFSIPPSVLPEVFDNATYFGAIDASLLGGAGPIGVHGMASVSSAVIVGSGGVGPGALTLSMAGGCTASLGVERGQGTGPQETIVARLDGQTSYARLAENAAANDPYIWARGAFDLGNGFEQADHLALTADPDAELYMVAPRLPVGAPWGHTEVRGTVQGFQIGTSKADLVRAAMEAAAFAARDIIEFLEADSDEARPAAKVSGGIAHSDWTMQFLADVLNRPVERSSVSQAAALGVARMAGLGVGDWPDADDFAATLAIDRRFEPGMDEKRRDRRVRGWHRCLRLAMSREETTGGV